ncbi:MAG: M60 family metallopeptidase [Bacteroidales bacterium]|jgi:hypothetical protein
MKLIHFFRTSIVGISLVFLTIPNNAYPAMNDLSMALKKLKDHISGVIILPASEITVQSNTIKSNISLLAQSDSIILKAFDLVSFYDKQQGAIFINSATKNGFTRATINGFELVQAMYALQQGLIDHAYTAQNVKNYPNLFSSFKFQSSKYFPGDVAPPVDSTVVHVAKINASVPKDWGSPVMYTTDPARRPTGCYLAPGTVVTVKVPQSLVNKGYKVRVGAHSWDLKAKTTVKRFDRVSLLFPVTDTLTLVSNPLGGGIYIEVPYLANDGIVDVEIINAVRSPFFSSRSFDKTTLADWQNIERKNPCPWADFESDKFMMQVPTSWIYNFSDPVTLMNNWDKGLDAVSELFGLPLVRNKTVLYLQIDILMRGTANFPGYPQSNYPYNPTTVETGNKNHFMLKGPQTSDWTVFHELGHAQSFTKFTGEIEAAVNVPFIAMQNMKFGMELNRAHSLSVGDKTQISLAQTAIMWMVTYNFRNGRAMDISNKAGDEVKYQQRGYAKYVEIANLFGWKVLSDFWKSVSEDYEKGITYPTNSDPTDNRILRMSKAAGVDLMPLIHFWGVKPVNVNNLKAAISAAGLKPSLEIYDRLAYYKTLIPRNNDEFVSHAHVIYPGTIGEGQSPLYGVGWYYTWLDKYGVAQGDSADNAMQNILDLYFPEGRPAPSGLLNMNENYKMEFYPNPASEFIQLIDVEKPYGIEISDLNGKVIMKRDDCHDNKIDISQLNKGIYSLKYFNDRMIKVNKLIKL